MDFPPSSVGGISCEHLLISVDWTWSINRKGAKCGCRNASYKGANLDSQLKIIETRNSSQLTIGEQLELYVCQLVTAIYSLTFFPKKMSICRCPNRRPETFGTLTLSLDMRNIFQALYSQNLID